MTREAENGATCHHRKLEEEGPSPGALAMDFLTKSKLSHVPDLPEQTPYTPLCESSPPERPRIVKPFRRRCNTATTLFASPSFYQWESHSMTVLVSRGADQAPSLPRSSLLVVSQGHTLRSHSFLPDRHRRHHSKVVPGPLDPVPPTEG